MKQLKYIQIFENFDSKSISKIFKFINKDSRTNFISMLTSVCNSIDIPISKVSDDYMQYLPFKKALELNRNIEDEPCDAKSTDIFYSYGVTGEKCKNGKIKRKWGTRTRSVTCTSCGGTGIKPAAEYKLKWVKFWFDKDGNYINCTGTDGRIREIGGSSNGYGSKAPSKDMRKYTIRSITNNDVLNVYKTGDILKLLINREEEDTIGVLWVNQNGRRYFIQSDRDGATDDYSNGWKVYGRYSYSLDTTNFSEPKLLTPISIESEDEDTNKVDPYTWNAIYNPNSYSRLSSTGIESAVSKAHFALVLDIAKLEDSTYSKKSDLQRKRRTEKSNLPPDNETIKQQNISKYIRSISNNLTLTKALSNQKEIFMRIMGWKYIGYYILVDRNMSVLNSSITYFNRLMADTDSSDSGYFLSYIKDYISSYGQSNLTYNQNITKAIEKTKSTLSGRTNYLKVVELLLNLFDVIYKKLSSMKIETLEDMEIFYQKCLLIKSSYRNDRFNYLRYLSNYIDTLNPSYVTRYISDGGPEFDKVVSQIEIFTKMVEKM